MESKTKGYKTVDVATPTEGRVLVRDMYWLCKDGDPKQAIFYNETAQGDKHKSIPERMLEYTSEKTGWGIEIVFLESGYRPQVNFN